MPTIRGKGMAIFDPALSLPGALLSSAHSIDSERQMYQAFRPWCWPSTSLPPVPKGHFLRLLEPEKIK